MIEDFTIADALEKGKGLFAKKSFHPNEVLLKFDGFKILLSDIDPSTYHTKEINNLLQIGEDLYLDILGHPTYFINHSCNPNCYIKISVNSAFLISLRNINIGEEISFDYSSTSTENQSTWLMNCSCSQFYCRKVISGYSSLPKDKQKEYIDNKIFPPYIIKKLT